MNHKIHLDDLDLTWSDEDRDDHIEYDKNVITFRWDFKTVIELFFVVVDLINSIGSFSKNFKSMN